MPDTPALPPAAYWHATPLHYLPHLVQTGALFAGRELMRRGLPIRPRPTVVRRDRKLGLDAYVHFSLVPVTPLLADKMQKGYPHVLIEFAATVADLPGAGYLLYNPKSWRHRDDFAPRTDPADKARFLVDWQAGKYPSAELLVPGTVPLAPHAVHLHYASREALTWGAAFASDLPASVSPEHFPAPAAFDFAPLHAYARACTDAGFVLPPPDLPFD